MEEENFDGGKGVEWRAMKRVYGMMAEWIGGVGLEVGVAPPGRGGGEFQEKKQRLSKDVSGLNLGQKHKGSGFGGRKSLRYPGAA